MRLRIFILLGFLFSQFFVSNVSAQESTRIITKTKALFDEIRSTYKSYEEGDRSSALKWRLEAIAQRAHKLVRDPEFLNLRHPRDIYWLSYELSPLLKAYGEFFEKNKYKQFLRDSLYIGVVSASFNPETPAEWTGLFEAALNESYNDRSFFLNWLRFSERVSYSIFPCTPDLDEPTLVSPELCQVVVPYKTYLHNGLFHTALEWARIRLQLTEPLQQRYPKAHLAALVDVLELEIKVGNAAAQKRILDEAVKLARQYGGEKDDIERLNHFFSEINEGGEQDNWKKQLDAELDKLSIYKASDIEKFWSFALEGKLSQFQLQKFNLKVRELHLNNSKNGQRYAIQASVCAPLLGYSQKLQNALAITNFVTRGLGPSNLRSVCSALTASTLEQARPHIYRLFEDYLNDEASTGFFALAFHEQLAQISLLDKFGFPIAAQVAREHFWQNRSIDDESRVLVEIDNAPLVLTVMLKSARDYYDRGDFNSSYAALTNLNDLANNWITSRWSRNDQKLGRDFASIKSILKQAMQYWMLLSNQETKLTTAKLFEQAFLTAQLSQLGDVALSVQAGLRQAVLSDGRQKQLVEDLTEKLGNVRHYKRLLRELYFVSENDGLKQAVVNAETELKVAQSQAGALLPVVEQYSYVAPISIEQIKAKLKPGEAFLFFVPVGNGTAAFYSDSYTTAFYSVSISAAQMDVSIAALREVLDPANFVNQLPEFRADIAYALYQHLFGPLAKVIGKIKHINVVAEGALASLPLQVLIRSVPGKKSDGTYDLKNLDWLAKYHAVTTLTSPRNFIVENGHGRLEAPKLPMIGFGDPIFDNGRNTPIPSQGFGAQLRSIQPSQLVPLPETRDELRNVAQITKAGDSNLFFGVAATEAVVKSLNNEKRLADYSIVYFATHGALPGQLDGFNEPGLVMTQPVIRSSNDDGYLSASEIANLKLNADWVVLSACNTAAGGQVGNQSLSGLSKAFFKAGARSLLVSHWEVFSQAAVELTGETFKALGNRETDSRAEAVRLAMVRVMQLPSNDPRIDKAHPAYWAPFAIIGSSGNS